MAWCIPVISEKQSKAHKRGGLPLENHSSVMAVDRVSSREERKQTQHKRRKSEQESQ